MGNILYKIMAKELALSAYIKYILFAIAAISIVASLSVAQAGTFVGGLGGPASASIYTTICKVFDTVKNIIFILGLTLMILGGALYAGANIMPGQSKGGFQGYGMAMIIGGVIGVAIAVAAPYILNVILSTNVNGAVGGTGVVPGGPALVSSLCPP